MHKLNTTLKRNSKSLSETYIIDSGCIFMLIEGEYSQRNTKPQICKQYLRELLCHVYCGRKIAAPRPPVES